MRSTMSRAGRDRQNDDDDDDVDSSSSSSSESESEGEDEGEAQVGEQSLQCVNQLTLVDDDDCNLLIQQAMQPEGGESRDMMVAILFCVGLVVSSGFAAMVMVCSSPLSRVTRYESHHCQISIHHIHPLVFCLRRLLLPSSLSACNCVPCSGHLRTFNIFSISVTACLRYY